ncbi:MAG: DUF1007 family protein [Alphaproteobacteria bacterium]|nr:DUF1007 family protein [Alphaproteobacteria bacterium]
MRRAAAGIAAMAALFVSVASTDAEAHPHVWIEINATLVLDGNGAVTAVSTDWTFDEFYSAWAIDGLDTNKNGTYEPEELKVLAIDNVTNLKAYSYFTYARTGETDVTFGDVTEYSMSYSGTQLTLHMTLPFTAAIDARMTPLSVAIYDPTFYIAMQFPEGAKAGVSGTVPPGCESAIVLPDATASGVMVPDNMMTLPEYRNYGARFAEKIEMRCKSSS